METKKRYYEDAYITEFQGEVLSCEPKGENWEVVLSETFFYPEGGGQPADVGTLGNAHVLDVQEKEDVVVHITDKPLAVGEKAKGKIQWKHRFDLMQNHSGEHILSGIICERYHCDNVGFHMGKDAILIDFNAKIPQEDLCDLEDKANEAIWKNTEVLAYYPEKEKLEALSYRSKKALSGAVRILEIPGYDRCACCGTHVAFAGAVGQIKILSAQNYKGGTRLQIVCGMRALADYQEKTENAAKISKLLSVPANEIGNAVEAMKKERDELKQLISRMNRENLQHMAENVQVAEKLFFFIENLDSKDLVHFADMVLEKTKGTVAVFTHAGTGYAYVLMSRTDDMRTLAGEMKKAFDCKGGGKPASVQGRTEAEPDLWKAFFKAQDFVFGH